MMGFSHDLAEKTVLSFV